MSDTRERCVHGWVDPMEWCTSCMAARIADLEEAARRYFNADGSVSFMVSAEAAVEARKADARRIAELEAEHARLVAGLESVIRSMPPDEHGYLLPGRVQAELVLGGSKRPLERARNQIAELEARVRERDEALKVAGDALRWLVNVVCGVGKSGDYPSISEDGAAVDAAKSALAHPLIGGAK